MSVDFQPGDYVDSRYRVLKSLGQGGMGSLFVAKQENFGREVALKVLPTSSASEPRVRARFVLEARAICHLQHPHIVTYYDFGTCARSGHLYLVMELLDGRTLAQTLREDFPLPASRILNILEQLCDALVESHRAGVIHRDLKPANVMLVRRGEQREFVKLIDFGIVRLIGSSDRGERRALTEKGMVVGTTGYLAPEYISDQQVDERTDVYALGVICYELIAGHRPFVHRDRVEVMRMHLTQAPRPLTSLEDGRDWSRLEALNEVVMRALAKKPSERIRTVRAFKSRLLHATRSLREDIHAQTTRSEPGLRAVSQVLGGTAIQFGTAFADQPDSSPSVPLMTIPEDTGSANIPSVPKRQAASSKPWRALEWLSLAAAISCSVAAGVALHSAVFEPMFVPSPARLMAYELERLGQRVDPVQRGLTSPDLPSSERASAGALSGTESPPGAAIASNQEAVPEEAPEPRSPLRNGAMMPHVGSQDAVDLRSELEIGPHEGRPARAASAHQSRVAGPKSLEPGASAPFDPVDVTTLVPVTVVARPAGEILYRKQVIGRDRVTLHVPIGRRCFRGRRLAVERRLCPEVVLGQHNQVLLDLRDSVDRESQPGLDLP